MNPKFLVWTELFAKIEKSGEISYTALFYRRDVIDLNERTREVSDIEQTPFCSVRCSPSQKWKFEQLSDFEIDVAPELVDAIFRKYTFDFMTEDCHSTMIDYLQNWTELDSNEQYGQMIFCCDIDQDEFL